MALGSNISKLSSLIKCLLTCICRKRKWKSGRASDPRNGGWRLKPQFLLFSKALEEVGTGDNEGSSNLIRTFVL